MKFKFSFEGFSIENAAAWVGAVFLTLILFASLHGLTSHFSELGKRQDKAEVKDVPVADLYETIPYDTSLSQPVFSVNGQEVALTKAQKPADAAQSQRVVTWSYQGEEGPPYWPLLDDSYKLCGEGQSQSPLDLHGAVTDPKLAPIKFLYNDTTGALYNDGRLVYVAVNPGNRILIFNETFELQKIYLRAPSEHLVNGRKYDMETQWVHKNQYGDHLVISILAEETQVPLKTMGLLIDNIPKRRDHPSDLGSIDLNKLLPASTDYYFYQGSLTFPPCDENVRWVVLKTPVKIAAQQVDKFLQHVKFNARPLQKVGSRKIARSW